MAIKMPPMSLQSKRVTSRSGTIMGEDRERSQCVNGFLGSGASLELSSAAAAASD